MKTMSEGARVWPDKGRVAENKRETADEEVFALDRAHRHRGKLHGTKRPSAFP
jgi:hypothetical protein